MIAAIYARKSTEQNGVADDQKSVAQQIEHAPQYATRKGWLLADDHDAMALDALRPERQDDTREMLTRELAAAREESERLADAIQAGGPMDVLVDRLRTSQARRMALEGQLAAAQSIVVPTAGPNLEQRLRAKLANWRGLLTRNIDSGRDVLRALLVGPLRFTPIIENRRRAYAFEGAVALERLVSGVIDRPTLTGVASPGGYGRLWTGDVYRRILLAA
jgi:hypothetical protein